MREPRKYRWRTENAPIQFSGWFDTFRDAWVDSEEWRTRQNIVIEDNENKRYRCELDVYRGTLDEFVAFPEKVEK